MDRKTKNILTTATLPDYRNPPINEVVCGMRFHTPDEFRITHIGMLWDVFRKEYPVVKHAPPIASAKGEIPIDNTTGMPLPRVWFINEADDQLIQFQFDGIYFNWRRRENDYPRYSHIMRNFRNVHIALAELFEKYSLGELKPTEYELSYINHISKGQGWNTIHDLPKVFCDLTWTQIAGRFLPDPADIAWRAVFPLPDDKGSLIVNVREARLANDRNPLFVLELKAIGIDEARDVGNVSGWFDLAHEWIVRGFADLTTAEVQKVFWEREDV